MASDQNLPPAPITAAMLTATGSISMPWTVWFRQVWNRIGGSSGSPVIPDGSITTPLLDDSAVTTAKLASQSVTAAKLSPGSVGTAAIAVAAVTGSNIAASTITATNIASYRKITGSIGSPVAISASVGVTPSGVADELIFVSGSGSHVDITAIPQISAGTTVGQRLTLRVPAGSNGVLLEDGTGLSQNGPADLGVDTFSISYEWDGSTWVCTGRD